MMANIGHPGFFGHFFPRTVAPVRIPAPDVRREVTAAPVSDLPGLVGSANDGGTGLVLPDPSSVNANGSGMAPLQANPSPSMPTDTTSQASAWANATDASAGNTAGVLAALQQSASNGGANMPLGPQLGFADVTTSSTSGSAGGLNPIFFVGLAIVGAIAFFVWKHHKKASE